MRRSKTFQSQKKQAAILFAQGKRKEANEMWEKANQGFKEWKEQKRLKSLQRNKKI